jgi:hypothetical protein
MEHTEVEGLLCEERRHAGDACRLERPIMGPCGEGSVNAGVMDCRLAMRGFRDGHALPLHPGIEHPSDQVQEALIPQFALGTTRGHCEVREDIFVEVRCGELDRNGRGRSVLCTCAQGVLASCKDG